MNLFIKKHRYQLILLLALLLITVISAGYLKITSEREENYKVKNLSELTVKKTETTNQSNLATSTTNKQTDKVNLTTTSLNKHFPTAYKANKKTTSSNDKQLIVVNEQSQNITTTIYVNEKKYQLKIPNNTSVYQAMILLSQQTDFDFKGQQHSGLGFFVEEINGLKNNLISNKYWIYYINGQSAKVGISNYIIKPNDIIKWQYENSLL